VYVTCLDSFLHIKHTPPEDNSSHPTGVNLSMDCATFSTDRRFSCLPRNSVRSAYTVESR